jgi:hypothetical protein
MTMLHISVNFQRLSVLSTKEKLAFNNYLDAIKRDNLNKQELAILTEKLSSAPLSILYKFSENAPAEFKKFFASHPKFNEEFSRRLKQLSYVPEPLFSPDGKMKISLFDQLMGAFVCHEMKKTSQPEERLQFTERACELGIPSALDESITRNLSAIETLIEKSTDINEINKKIKFHAQEIGSHAEKLGGLYWSIGYLYSAISLLKAADLMYQKFDKMTIEQRNLTQQKLDDNIQTITFVKQAIKYAVYSQYLENSEQSTKILEAISPEGLFHKYAYIFKDWPEAQNHLMACCQGFEIPNSKEFIAQVIKDSMTEIINLDLPIAPSSFKKISI